MLVTVAVMQNAVLVVDFAIVRFRLPDLRDAFAIAVFVSLRSIIRFGPRFGWMTHLSMRLDVLK